MFNQLPLHERLLKALAELDFVEPTPVQAAAIPPALEGKDLRVTARTGSGKTAAFVLPLLHRLLAEEGRPAGTRALILLPTRELAQQTLKQVERFARYTFLRGALITGGEDFKVQAALMRKDPDVLIGTPGRLLEHLEAGNLALEHVQVLVLDEADRMLDMGFADAVLRLAETCAARQQTLLFSATGGGSALHEMVQRVLREPQVLRIDGVADISEGIAQQIITADDWAHKERLLGWLLENETYAKAIVFTNTRAAADRLYGRLVAAGQKVFVLHGEKDQKERKLAIERIRQGGARILVATDVAARGLDLEGLDLVVNFDMPHSGDDYLHRIGRTGRAGGEGLAVSLVDHTEWNRMSSIERYLKQRFERRVIKGLKGSYQGPKKVKASGKAAGSKKKKRDGKEAPAKRRARPAAAPLVNADGSAPLKRRPSPPSE